MIRIAITNVQLRQAIEAIKPGWESRMKPLVVALGQEDDPEFKNEWSDIKQAYIDAQASKCAFCEKPLEGRIEQDVEHFRPKAAVAAWPVPKDIAAELESASVRVTQPKQASRGYKFLAYHPLNYVTACKTCNSVRKRNFFPIAGRWKLAGKNPADLATEKPYLIYPLSDLDDDPEALIEFSAITPRPKAGLAEERRLRARVTIAFFGLDDLDGRKDLLIDRFETLEKVYFALKGRADFAAVEDRNRAAAVVTAYQTGRKRHTNCMKHFITLYDRDPARAKDVYEAARTYLESVSG